MRASAIAVGHSIKTRPRLHTVPSLCPSADSIDRTSHSSKACAPPFLKPGSLVHSCGCLCSPPAKGARMKKSGLDAADIRILSAIQQHGQLSKTKLAEVVNLSPTPCWARLDRLKAAGFIRGYHADIALERIVDFTQVVVTVALSQHRKQDFDRFEAHIRELDEITECIATGGGMDYVMKVVVTGLPAFQILMDNLLLADLGIDKYMTYFATRQIKAGQPNLAKLVARAGQ